MKLLHQTLRVLLVLLLLMPILGGLGVFPEPTADLYTPEGWAFMSALMESGFVLQAFTLVCVVCLILMVMNRTALAALLLAPLTVNIIGFHLFLDAAPISAAAIPAYLFLLLNLYFLWHGRKKYEVLWKA